MRFWKRLGVLTVVGCCAAANPWDGPPVRRAAQPQGTVSVAFSPAGGCTEAVVTELVAARQSVLVQAYRLTSPPIMRALFDAHARGVEVIILLDDGAVKEGDADFFVGQGMRVGVDQQHAAAHNKVMIIDGRAVITGSFNFTKSAQEHNAENLVVIRDAKVADLFAENFTAHAEHSEQLAPAGAAPPAANRPRGRRIIPMTVKGNR